MNDLTELEETLPARLERLSGQVGLGGLSRSGIERRVAELARRRRVRRGIASGALAVAMAVVVGVVTLPDGGDDGTRVVTGDRTIAPASPGSLPSADGVDPGPTVASASEPTTSVPVSGVEAPPTTEAPVSAPTETTPRRTTPTTAAEVPVAPATTAPPVVTATPPRTDVPAITVAPTPTTTTPEVYPPAGTCVVIDGLRRCASP